MLSEGFRGGKESDHSRGFSSTVAKGTAISVSQDGQEIFLLDTALSAVRAKEVLTT